MTSEGFSTLEVLIAIAVLTLSISASAMLVFGSQSLIVDTVANADGLAIAQNLLESALATSTASFGSLNSTQIAHENGYASSLTVSDNGLCEKWATGSVTWSVSPIRQQNINLTTDFSDPALALALGGDCGGGPPGSPPGGGGPTWQKPRLFASYKFNPGQPVSLDVLDRIAYVTDNKNKLNIVDTSGATLGLSGGFLSPPYDATQRLNDIDVAKWRDPAVGTQKVYAYAARGNSGSGTNQFQVIDVTSPSTPVLKKSLALGGATPPSGSHPEGWRVKFFDNHVFLTTRETAGFEFHVFNVSDPANPSEIGPGLELNGTTNELSITKTTISGVVHYIVFLATDRSAKEIMVLDVPSSTNIPSLITTLDLGASNDALSLYLVGSRLYVGRQATAAGPELYVYNVTLGDDGAGHATATFTQVGTAEIGADINAIRISGKFAFLATSKASDEFQVWDISNPAVAVPRADTSPVNLPNKIVGEMDYEDPYIYVGSQATNPLQILYSAP